MVLHVYERYCESGDPDRRGLFVTSRLAVPSKAAPTFLWAADLCNDCVLRLRAASTRLMILGENCEADRFAALSKHCFDALRYSL